MSREVDAAQLLQLDEIERVQAERLARATYCAAVPDWRVECTDCGEDVDPRRLRCVPSTRRCVDCQNRAERK